MGYLLKAAAQSHSHDPAANCLASDRLGRRCHRPVGRDSLQPQWSWVAQSSPARLVFPLRFSCGCERLGGSVQPRRLIDRAGVAGALLQPY